MKKTKPQISAWVSHALTVLNVYLNVNPRPFLAEDFVRWCRVSKRIDMPRDGRTWGAVFSCASRDRIIKKVGYALAVTSKNSPKYQWQRISR